MRHLLAVLMLAHGVAHLPGFAMAWGLMPQEGPPNRFDFGAGANRAIGAWWLILAAAFAVLAVTVWIRAPWLAVLLPVAILSAVWCVLAWPAAKLGLIANLAIIVAAILAIRFPGEQPAMRDAALEDLWRTAPTGAASPAAVRLRMHGEIKLGGWHPFVAEQVISPRGMIWAGTASLYGILPVRGSDSVIDGLGRLDWRLFDVIRVAHGEGPDIDRSASGRMLAERDAWLPSAKAGPVPPVFSFQRWGNPDGGAWGYYPFGVIVEETRTFGGYTIPSRIRAGWHHGTDRFETEGVFFRATIDAAEFR